MVPERNRSQAERFTRKAKHYVWFIAPLGMTDMWGSEHIHLDHDDANISEVRAMIHRKRKYEPRANWTHATLRACHEKAGTLWPGCQANRGKHTSVPQSDLLNECARAELLALDFETSTWHLFVFSWNLHLWNQGMTLNKNNCTNSACDQTLTLPVS